MRFTTRVGAFVVLAAALGSAERIEASSIVLDQQNPNTTLSAFNGGYSGVEWQQGATAGLAGLLSQVDIYSMTGGTTRLFVNRGAPLQTDLDDFSTTTAMTAGWNSFDVSSALIMMTPGFQFVIGISGLDSNTTAFDPGIGFSTNDYLAGALYVEGIPFEPGTWDMNFKTYVQVAQTNPVPEPASIVLLGAGAAGLLARARRRRQVHA